MPRKAKKKAESVDATVAGLQPELNGPELKSASDAGLARQLEKEADARMRAVSPAAPSGEIEQLAEAGDTFEQAYDEVPLPEKPKSDPDPLEVPPPRMVEARQAEDHAAEAEHSGDEEAEEHPPVRLERLQKILSQAGIASRRHAEEMITQGRVQVNGQVVTELGSKADPDRDHIRVDGKLIHGAERLRYFVLNKPKGYVTTVSDPEGRPTVMQFFEKMNERLYPVGRLDYQSEGLLLVTNDGDLANKLTRAATGVEKTYLVKVSGQPSEDELDRLREGVAIDRARPGEGRVHTSPATIREARSGDNPWYEVVLTEGRNRELRKMFEEIGHHVEKIRRVGYGPLILDIEPGQFRELDPDELAKLRLAAEGKWRKPKPKPAPQGRPAPRRERGSAPVRDDRKRWDRSGESPRGRESRAGEYRKQGKTPRFEKPAERQAERQDEGFRRPAEARGRATGRGYARPRSEEAPRPGFGAARGSKPEGGKREWSREAAPPRSGGRRFSEGGPRQSQDDRPRFAKFDGPRREAGKGERGTDRGAFPRPPRPGQGRNQKPGPRQGPPQGSSRPPQGSSRSPAQGQRWEPRREQRRFGKDGASRSEKPARRDDRGGSARPAAGFGAQRSARPGGRTGKPPSGRSARGARGAGPRSPGRGRTDRPQGGRGKPR